jgi:hypothetical protein
VEALAELRVGLAKTEQWRYNDMGVQRYSVLFEDRAAAVEVLAELRVGLAKTEQWRYNDMGVPRYSVLLPMACVPSGLWRQ